jgi:hypothetical protein
MFNNPGLPQSVREGDELKWTMRSALLKSCRIFVGQDLRDALLRYDSVVLLGLLLHAIRTKTT